MNAVADPLLSVTGLHRHYRKPRRHPFAARQSVRAVAGIDLYIRPGETLGIVGESGCGKSTLGRIVVGIDQPTSGAVRFAGTEISALGAAGMKPFRRDLQMIFQNPLAALDPRLRVGPQIREAMDIHDIATPPERDDLVMQMLDAVGLDTGIAARYPHQISGGQAQRIVIARALTLKSKLLVCDEPVSALDVSVQATVTRLLADLQRKSGIAYLFISHDLKVVKQLAHRTAVMYLGRIVEEGATGDVYDRAFHPYTKALISAVPKTTVPPTPRRLVLKGDPPSPLNPPSGCSFHTRCPFATDICSRETPELRDLATGHRAACHHAEDLKDVL
ncbi:MAG: ATP-binding cassette domain-containing protein [Rhodospirillales bacterium]|jgi:oligopeptide/dipeptide ABC transporter ATP-binding protein